MKMRVKKLVISSIVMLLVLVLSACQSMRSYTGPDLHCLIYDNENLPVHNVSIAINDKQQGASDIRGHFAIALKQGKTYTIRLSKEGYETIENKITFDGPSSLFYVNMVSEKQLLDDAFKALRQKKWAEAKKLLERAQAINPSIGSSYLMAIYYFRTGQKEQSLNLLQSLLEESSENEYVVKLIGYISSTD